MTVTRAALVLAILGAAGAGCTDGGGGGPGGPAVTITSATCTRTGSTTGYDQGDLTFAGTASGPMGARLQILVVNQGGGQSGGATDCGYWDADGSSLGTFCTNAADLSPITWDEDAGVSWCVGPQSCDPSPDPANGDDPIKHVVAQLTDASGAVLDEADQDVPCQ